MSVKITKCVKIARCHSPDGTGKQNRVLAITLVGLTKRPKEALGKPYHCGQDAVFL